jgi:hypothetical protein
MSKWKKFAFMMVGWDPEIWNQLPAWDRSTMIAQLVLLSLVAIFAATEWGILCSQLAPPYFAICVVVFAFSFIFFFDRLLAGHDGRLAGPLRKPGPQYTTEFWLRLAPRLLMAGIFAFFTSMGAEMAAFHDAITLELNNLRWQKNQQIEQQFGIEANDLIQRYLGPIGPQRQRLQQIMNETYPLLVAARQARTDAAERQQTAKLDEEREWKGSDGRAAGKDKKYRDAEAREDRARADLAKANDLISIYQPRLDETQRKLNETQPAFEKASIGLQPKLQELDDQKKTYLQPAARDILLSLTALHHLYLDPENGYMTTVFGWAMMLVFMAIEMSYVLVMIVFAPASLAPAYMIKEAKERLFELDREFMERTNWTRPPDRPYKPDLHIVH